jgi:integrase
MAIFKRRQNYWADFTVNGIRYRKSLKTTDWRKALSEEKRLIKRAESGELSERSDSFLRLGFKKAADVYLEDRKAELAESSYKKERQLLVQPTKYIGSLSLQRIETRHLLDYRNERAKTVGPTIVNMEMGVIGRILRRVRRWNLVGEGIKPLKRTTPHIGRALTEVEQAILLQTAASKPEWMVAYHAATLALNTTMRGCEIRGLQWRDVNLLDRTLVIQKSKTLAGCRTIPLNDDAFCALMAMRDRARLWRVRLTVPHQTAVCFSRVNTAMPIQLSRRSPGAPRGVD